MLRLASLVFCILLAIASAGRYRAEVSVRAVRDDITYLEQAKADELRRIQILRAELAYLESPDRLEKIAREMTPLRPASGRQFLSSQEFLAAVGVASDTGRGPRNAWSSEDMSAIATLIGDMGSAAQ